VSNADGAGLMFGQAIAQKTDSSPNDSDVAVELKALREALLQTQKQMASQQEEIEALKQLLSAKQPAPVGTQGDAPQVVNAALTSSSLRPMSTTDHRPVFPLQHKGHRQNRRH
jgi:hypothetical protein